MAVEGFSIFLGFIAILLYTCAFIILATFKYVSKAGIFCLFNTLKAQNFPEKMGRFPFPSVLISTNMTV